METPAGCSGARKSRRVRRRVPGRYQVRQMLHYISDCLAARPERDRAPPVRPSTPDEQMVHA